MSATTEETYTPDGLALAVVGGGAFVRALRRTGHHHVTGYDIDDQADGLVLCDRSRPCDTLDIRPEWGPWDVAIGNPRFGGPCVGKGREPGEPAYIGAHHIAHVLPMVQRAAFVLPFSWWATTSVRRVLFDRHPPTEVWPIEGRVWTFLREAAVFVWDIGRTRSELEVFGEPSATRLSAPMPWRSDDHR